MNKDQELIESSRLIAYITLGAFFLFFVLIGIFFYYNVLYRNFFGIFLSLGVIFFWAGAAVFTTKDLVSRFRARRKF